MVEQLLLFQQRLEGLASDGERAARLREEIRAQPRDVAVERVGRGVRGGQERAADDAPQRRVGQRLRQLVAQERGAGRRGALGDGDPLGRHARGIEVRARRVERGGRLGQTLGEHRQPVLGTAVSAQQDVVRAARDEIGVQRGLAAPALERLQRVLAAELGQDKRAVDLLVRVEALLPHAHEAPQPVLGELAPRRKAVGGEVAQAMVVRVVAHDRRGDRLELETVIEKGLDGRLEQRAYHDGSASLAQGRFICRRRAIPIVRTVRRRAVVANSWRTTRVGSRSKRRDRSTSKRERTSKSSAGTSRKSCQAIHYI